MSYLIDTCALSEFTKLRPARSVDQWFASTPESSQFISVLTIGELEKGVHKLPASRRRNTLERWLAQLTAGPSVKKLGISQTTARARGRTYAPAQTSRGPR